jgi:hypothetical protein
VSFTGPSRFVSFQRSRSSKTQLSRDAAWRSSARGAKTKKAFQGIAPEGLVLNECRALRSSTLRIECAAVVAIDPRLRHGSAHTGGHPLGAGQIEWPA